MKDEVIKNTDGTTNGDLTDKELTYVVGGLTDLLNKPKEEPKEKKRVGLFGQKKSFEDQIREISSDLN